MQCAVLAVELSTCECIKVMAWLAVAGKSNFLKFPAIVSIFLSPILASSQGLHWGLQAIWYRRLYNTRLKRKCKWLIPLNANRLFHVSSSCAVLDQPDPHFPITNITLGLDSRTAQ